MPDITFVADAWWRVFLNDCGVNGEMAERILTEIELRRQEWKNIANELSDKSTVFENQLVAAKELLREVGNGELSEDVLFRIKRFLDELA